MFGTFLNWLGDVFSAKYTFSEHLENFIDFLEEIGFDDNVTNLREGLLAGFVHFEFVIPLFLLLLFTSTALFGKKIFSLLRFSALFVGGFIIGVYVLSEPILREFPNLPTWVIGLCIGIVAAVLSKPIWTFSYGVFFGYGSYLLICGGAIPFLHKNYFLAALVAAGVIFVVFRFREYVEMGLTALLGAYGVCAVFADLFGKFDGIFSPSGNVWLVVLSIIFGSLAFVFQFWHRDRFKIK